MIRNPENMTYEEVAAEVASLHDDIQKRGRRLHELAQAVYRRARRDPVDDSTAVYLTYASALDRYAGTLEQASNRSMRTAKVLHRLPPKETVKSPQEARKKASETALYEPPSMESLIDSYMSEVSQTPVSDES